MSDEQHGMGREGSTELGSLPRELSPGRLLEERTVRALRARRLLSSRPISRNLMVAAAAAALALFASGFGVGQWAATRAVRDAVEAERDVTAMQVAQSVQRTGSAYVMALATLAALADSAPENAMDQGREAAKSALYAAAGELASLVPDDPVAVQIRRYLAGVKPPETIERRETRSLVWF